MKLTVAAEPPELYDGAEKHRVSLELGLFARDHLELGLATGLNCSIAISLSGVEGHRDRLDVDWLKIE